MTFYVVAILHFIIAKKDSEFGKKLDIYNWINKNKIHKSLLNSPNDHEKYLKKFQFIIKIILVDRNELLYG